MKNHDSIKTKVVMIPLYTLLQIEDFSHAVEKLTIFQFFSRIQNLMQSKEVSDQFS